MTNLQSFVLPTSVKSFRDYFRLKASTEMIVRALGYEFDAAFLELPKADSQPLWGEALRQQLIRHVEVIQLTTETARREVVVAPLLLEIMRQLNIVLQVKYPIEVSPQLRGDLEYVLFTPLPLLVVEAKLGDPVRGLKQLAAQMIALDKLADNAMPLVYGAVTIGTIWQFAVLHREEKRLTQDLSAYTIPERFNELLNVLVGILTATPHSDPPPARSPTASL